MNLNLSIVHLSEQVLNQYLMQWVAPIQRHRNVSYWLTTDSPAMSPVRLHLPQERTFELKELEAENARLKKVLAEAHLDNAALKAA